MTATAQEQTLVETYVTECAALRVKPNSYVLQHLHAQETGAKTPAAITELNFSKTILGRKGILPLLTVIARCVKLRLLNVNDTGLNDFACAALAEALSRHPSVCIVMMKFNFLTADSIPPLKKLTYAFLDRAQSGPLAGSSAAAVKRRNDETEFEIHIDVGPGIFESVVAELAVIRRTTNRLELEAALAVPQPPSAAAPLSEVSQRASAAHDDFSIDKKHSAAFQHDLLRMQRRLQQEAYLNAKLSRRLRLNQDQWLTLGVYFSTTYTEFPDEAQLIFRKVIPLLNARLRRLKVHLVPVMFHTTEDEDFRVTNTHTADGPLPIHEARLPPYRRGRAHGESDATATERVVYAENATDVVDLRELAVRDGCDIFVALHSDMFRPSCHVVDWNALETSADAGAIPTLLYRRRTHQVPIGLQHLFDYKAHLQFELAEKNHQLEHGNGPKPKLADMAAERKVKINDFAMFQRKVADRVPVCMQRKYDATFAHVDNNGLVRFNLSETLFESLTQDLFTSALAYRQKRLSGCSPAPSTIPLGFDIPTISKQNWRTGNVKDNPFAHLEHKLGMDDPERNKDPFFVKDVSASILSTRAPIATAQNPTGQADDDSPPGAPFQCIFGQRGSGRTTQLRAVGSRIGDLKHRNSQLIVTHSVTSGRRTLHGVMTAILRQLVPPQQPVFRDWPSTDDDESLVHAFCDALKTRCSLIPRFTQCLWILLDDDDAVEFGSSFLEAFSSPQRRAMLRHAVPYEGMHIRVIATSNVKPAPHEELAVHVVPAFDEIEAADLFVHMMLGIDTVPDPVLAEIKHAAHYLVLQKKHGIKPLYLYLCAREMLYANEEVSMVNIAEMLPGTVEELLTVTIRQQMPQDLVSVFDAVTLAPEPLDGGLLRFCVFPIRRSPAFSPLASARSWYTKRQWGAFTQPAPSAAALLFSFFVNYLHLFQNCTRSRNRGIVTQRRNNFSESVWRQEVVFLSRTIAETLAQRPKDRRPGAANTAPDPALTNPWYRAVQRTSLLRDDVYTIRSLVNSFEPLRFFATPHPLFQLLHHRRFDDVRLLVERQLLLLCADALNVPSSASPADGSKYGIDGPVRLQAHHIKSKFNELRISLQFAANDAEALVREKATRPLAVLIEYMTFLMEHWGVLTRHPAFLYACPQYAPPLIRQELERSLQATHKSSYMRVDTCFSFAKKCYETALLLTSHAQEQQNAQLQKTGPASPSRGTNTSSVPTSDPSAATGDATAGSTTNTRGPRIRSVVKASVVSKQFVVTYRTIADAKPHEITPTMASPQTHLASESDENGGASFGYVGVVVLSPENPTKTSADYGFTTATARNFSNQTLAKGTYFLSIKAHTNAICALDVIETRHAVRFATAAYFDTELCVTALVLSAAGEACRLQLVGRLNLEGIQRPMFSQVSLSPITKSQVSENGMDDGQRCPMVAVGVKNLLYVFEGQRFGHDNLYNRKGGLAAQVYSGHDNKIVNHGFSPAGAKVFSIDVSGHCYVWGSPESPCPGTILAVTNFGALPSFARFVDHETLLVVTNRGITLWNSANSQVQQLMTNPTRQPMDSSMYSMLHYQPPAYIYGALEDTELLNLPPHVKVHRLLEQLREKKHPTVTYMAFDGITLLDTQERAIKVYRRQHIPPQNELECDKPPVLLFAKEATHVCPILPQVSTSDAVGNKEIDQWRWFLGSRHAAAIDAKENMVKVFDLLKGQQYPLFFAVRSSGTGASDSSSSGSSGGGGAGLFEPLDEAVLGGEHEDRLVVAERNGTIHVITITKGPLLYPTPPLTTS